MRRVTLVVVAGLVGCTPVFQPVCDGVTPFCDGGVSGGTGGGAGGGSAGTGGGRTDEGLVVDGVRYQPDGGPACLNAVRSFATAAECTPATCSDGCCDGTRCIRTGAQSASRCGVYAEACGSCSGSDVCDRGSCRGTGPCTGCRNTDICHSGTLNSLCGGPSTGCTLCENCVNQQCVNPPVRVGDPCTGNADCAVMGRGAYCRLQTNSGVAYPGGFCTFPCEGTYSVCSSSSECVSFPTRFGETERICAPNCNQRGDAGLGCRAGYTCYPGLAWNGPAVCWIAPAPSTVITAPIGSPCVEDADCGAGRSCLRSIGVSNGYYGGYCTAVCTPGGACGSGSDVCVSERFMTPVGEATVNGCKAPCTAPGYQGECRAEYMCQGSPAGNWCAPLCTWGRTCPSGQTCNQLSGGCQ